MTTRVEMGEAAVDALFAGTVAGRDRQRYKLRKAVEQAEYEVLEAAKLWAVAAGTEDDVDALNVRLHKAVDALGVAEQAEAEGRHA